MIVAVVAAASAEISGAWPTRLYNKIAGHAKRIRRFKSFSVYGVGAAFASFLAPLPAFTSMSVADIV
jgi:predicted amino acid racemase